jgi:UDP-N-acetylglucosamine 4-epimerase
MTTWFVTGAAGFIGSNLCAHLLDQGDEVVGFDNFATGAQANIDRLAAKGGRNFRFVEGDILNGALLAQSMTRGNVVVHLAAQVSVQHSIDFAAHTNSVNVSGFLEAHAAAAAMDAKRFLYASSCAVYGDNPDLPLAEDAIPRPLSPYAVSKLVDEYYAETLRSRYPSLDAMGLRFFNIYGPWQDHRGGYAAVVPRWIDACLRGERPIVFGDGEATRDFCFVGDLAAIIRHVGIHGGSGKHRVFNIGTGRATSLAMLYSAIEAALKVRGCQPPAGGPDYRPRRAGDIVHSLGSIERMHTELGVAATTDLAGGISRLLDEQYGLKPI